MKINRKLLAAVGSASALLALRLLLVLRYAFDSDEPQHMHVSWAWAHGLMQYRDVFDNHMPLFHIVMSPLFLWPADDVRLLFAARYAVVPFFILSIFLVWKIARSLYDVRTATWTAAMTALFAPFFLGTLEFRTDDLWVVFWLAAIAMIVGEGSIERRSWAAGLFLGLAFAVSMKSTLFVISVVGAFVTYYFVIRRHEAAPRPRVRLRVLGMSVVAVIVPPLLVAGGFALAGAWKSFEYGVFLHNVFPHETKWRVIWLLPAFYVTRAGLRGYLGRGVPDRVARMRIFVFLACMIYGGLLCGVWPMLSLESFLPLYPLVFIVVVPLILESSEVLGGGHALVKACIAVEFVTLLAVGRPWVDQTGDEVALVNEVLAMTTPNELVMDLKGETLFRERPYYLVIESITNRKLRMGMIGDDISDILVRSQTHVVASDRLPARSRRFVQSQYVPWGQVRVAGFRLAPMRAGDIVEVDVRIPGDYVLLGDSGSVPVSLDGTRFERQVFVRPGHHIIVSAQALTQPLLVWSGAMRAPNASAHRVQAIRDGEPPRRRERVMAQDDARSNTSAIATAAS